MVPHKVKEVLDRNGLQALEFEPGSTPTATMAAAKIGVEVGQIAKSILLRGKDGRYSMVVLPGDRRISNAKLKQLMGTKQSMASAEEAARETGFPPGGVCPFGVQGMAIYLDRGLEQYDTIYPAAGNDATGVPMSFSQLREITGGIVSDLAG
jgi:prolyl-tRNA editing enzyme YbaK/EbsC (Cys-tRNA(Pro) deacylase)